MRSCSRLAVRGLIAFACVSLIVFAAPARQTSVAPWQRLNGGQPILAPQGDGFESAGVFNPAVIKKGGRFVMLYRAQDKRGTSRLGYSESVDGIHFTRRSQPVLAPEAAYEKDGGVEDPRLVRVGGTYYLTYTGYNTREAQLCLATSKDLVHWQRRGVIMPANKGRWNVGWTKSGAILTEKVNGKYWMYYMADPAKDVNEMGVAYSTDLLHWTEALDQPVLRRRPGRFDAKVVEPGPPPIMTKAGILLIYNGADEHLRYATGWVLFDKRDPTKVIARADLPVFRAEREWERVGQVPNVVFVEGMVRDGGRWLFYYGGADKFVGVAAVAALPFS
ncbi:MAG TPA: glycoside hydrolase family 130 protein [Blastocatellia bacterium]|nr:glycoside hydrolase family 130 protein [Blastocatellia bacterium]